MSAATLWLDSCTLESGRARTTTSLGERRTLAAARLGNRDAFVQMVLPYAPGLYRRALRITGSAADAEDARQEALLKAFSRLNQFAGQQNDDSRDDLHAWVSRITTNASIDVIRQRREGRFVSLEEPGLPPEETLAGRLAARDENPEEQYARREMRLLVARTIVRLTPELRKVCLLRDVLQYSTQEVAERLGISTVAVRLRLFRAHRRLREGLRDIFLKRRAAARRSVRRGSVKVEARKRDEAFSPMSGQPEFACGD